MSFFNNLFAGEQKPKKNVPSKSNDEIIGKVNEDIKMYEERNEHTEKKIAALKEKAKEKMKTGKKPEFELKEVKRLQTQMIENQKKVSALQNQVATAQNFTDQSEFIQQMEDITKLNANLANQIKDNKIDELKDRMDEIKDAKEELKDLMDDLVEDEEEDDEELNDLQNELMAEIQMEDAMGTDSVTASKQVVTNTTNVKADNKKKIVEDLL